MEPGKTQAELDNDLFTKMKATERKRKPPPVVKKEEEEGEPCKRHFLIFPLICHLLTTCLSPFQFRSPSCGAWSGS